MTDGSSGDCAGLATQVSHLQAQVSRLQAEVANLRRENNELRDRLDKVRRALQAGRYACRQYMAQTGEVLAHRSGVPPGRWAYCRGGYTVARNVYAVLSSREG